VADLNMRISWEDLPALRAEIERLRARIEGDPSLATYVTVEGRYLQARRELAEAQANADRWKADYRTVNAALAEAQDEVRACYSALRGEQGIELPDGTEVNVADLQRQVELGYESTARLAEARALLTAVAESGVEWSTPGYVCIQVDRATWSAITAAPTPTPAPAVSGFDFPTEGA